jgi:hypothetical protein
MNEKSAKRWRKIVKSLGRDPRDAQYHWIKRSDGTIVRQLQDKCGRAVYQLCKSLKGVNRVQVRR